MVPFIITYIKKLPDIGNIVRNHAGILHNTTRMRKRFPAPPLEAFKRERNLADVLVHGKLKRTLRSTESQSGNFCDSVCIVCDMFRKGV